MRIYEYYKLYKLAKSQNILNFIIIIFNHRSKIINIDSDIYQPNTTIKFFNTTFIYT